MEDLISVQLYLIYIMAACTLVLGGAGCSCNRGSTGSSEEAEALVEPHRYGFEPSQFAADTGVVRSGDNFSGLLGRLGLTSREAYNLTQICPGTFDPRKLRGGNAYEAYYSADSLHRLEYLVYRRDVYSDVVFKTQDSLAVWVSLKPVETISRYAEVTISSSLWNDMLAAGATPLLILKLSDIYAWTIDFFALQKGDSFKVYYDETLVDGRVTAVDTVRYAVFTHGSTSFPCYMYNQGDGGNVYWNEKGESMRKAFLKAPLNYSRISSGYGTRTHPITRQVHAHTGVDYAAPTGTPVVAIGDGKVISAGYEGNAGNMVKIRHNSVYTTAYLHLSKFGSGIRAGAMVRQGQIIGYVGSTGRSTGPHLDFRVWKNGSPINPLRMDFPPFDPIASAHRDSFLALVDSLNVIYGSAATTTDALPVSASEASVTELPSE